MNLLGTLDNTGTTLALNATTGSWNLVGGTLEGGTLSESGGAELVFTSSGGTLDGVTTDSDLDLASNAYAYATIKDGLTLNNATVYLGNASGTTSGLSTFQARRPWAARGPCCSARAAATASETTRWYHADDRPTDHGAGQQRHLDNGGALINQGTISADDSGGLVGGFVYDTGFTGG